MTKSINNLDLSNQLENLIKDFVKEKLELLMKEELKHFIDTERPDLNITKNGYYQRTLDTKHGRIDDLNVPRDRQGEFQTQVFQPYQRRDEWLGQAIIHMYQTGMSTREIGKFVEKILGKSYSAATISNITETTVQDILAWRERPLQKRYSVLFLDGMYIKVRRDVVDKEVIYFVLGVTEEGHKEILGYYIGGRESALGWQEILNDLYKRGLKQVLLGVFDGLAGLEEAFKSVYPKADVQRCIVHKVRNTLNAVRKKDQFEIAQDLKLIYKAMNKERALAQFEIFREKWASKYQREIESWERDLSCLLRFLDYPVCIQSQIYTSNWIERMNKEIRKRIRPMNSLPDMKAAEKIVYLTVQGFNDQWSKRISSGFAQAAPFLKAMFWERYGE